MRRLHGIRSLALVAILLVAASVSGRTIGVSECECCGPVIAAAPAPVGPCCVSAVERRMATFNVQPVPGPLAVITRAIRAVDGRDRRQPRSIRPSSGGPPLHVRISVFRI